MDNSVDRLRKIYTYVCLTITRITWRTNTCTSESKGSLNYGEKSTYLLKCLAIGLLVVSAFMFVLYTRIDLNKRCSTYHT